jgi:hypothetical protein
LAGLTPEQRDRLIAANADGPMTLDWPMTSYDLAMKAAIDAQRPGHPAVLPDPLTFPGVASDGLPPPKPSDVVPPLHDPPAPSTDVGVSALATASSYQSDHVQFANLGGVVRIDYALLLNPPTPTSGDCSGSSVNCFWFNAAQASDTSHYVLHWGVKHGKNNFGSSGVPWKLELSGYTPSGAGFGGISTAGNTSVSTSVYHSISLRMIANAQYPDGSWVSQWAIYLDGVQKGSVWIGGLFLEVNTQFWQELYETNDPCTTQRGASLFDNVTYTRLFDPVVYSVTSGTVAYDNTCDNTNFQEGYGAAVDLRQTTRTVPGGTTIHF